MVINIDFKRRMKEEQSSKLRCVVEYLRCIGEVADHLESGDAELVSVDMDDAFNMTVSVRDPNNICGMVIAAKVE